MPEPEAAAQDITEIAYGENKANTMDVYLPAKRTVSTTKVIIFIHGGSWFDGDKKDFTALAASFRDKGYATATINYRLTRTAENNIHPSQVNDISKVVDYISSKSAAWKISGDKMALFGASAGAHLSLLYTYAYNFNDKVRTVISLAAPSNLTDTRNVLPEQVTVVEWLIGSGLSGNLSAYQQASPYFRVGASVRPTLLFHGKLDAIVPVQQSIDLKAKLDQFEVRSKLILYDNTGHEVVSPSGQAAFFSECEAWLKTNLN